jgi:chromosome segregation ATPase
MISEYGHAFPGRLAPGPTHQTPTSSPGEYIAVPCEAYVSGLERQLDEARTELARLKAENAQTMADVTATARYWKDELARLKSASALAAEQAWAGLPESIQASLAKRSFVAGHEHAGVELAMARDLAPELRSTIAKEAADAAKLRAYRSKYHAARREVRRLNAANRAKNLRIAELSRLNSEHAASAETWRADSHGMRVRLAEAEQTIAELRTDLAWESGWDLFRKAQMGSVVDAALAWNDCDRRLEIEAAELRLAAVVDEYRAAIDQAQQRPPAEGA